MFPKARSKNLVVQQVDGETLVYDLRTDRAHCLNRTAALVWNYCDGKTDIPRMARKLAAVTAEPADAEVVLLALQGLHKARLLDVAPATGTLSRRDVMRRLGKAAAITIPLVTSILAPEAAQAASCVANATACNADKELSGTCCCKISGHKTYVCIPGYGCNAYDCTY